MCRGLRVLSARRRERLTGIAKELKAYDVTALQEVSCRFDIKFVFA